MIPAGPPLPAIEHAAVYETLRAAVLSDHLSGQRGLSIIIHRGLAAWLGELTQEAPPPTPVVPPTAPIRSTPPASTPSELTRVLAGIIVTLTTGEVATHG